MYHAHNLSPRVQLEFNDESRTQQSEAEESNINNIMAKYESTGLITHVKEGGNYENLPEPMEYQEALNRIIEAQTSFEALPAAARKEFGNDPRQFLEFVGNPDNVRRMGELGLLNDPITNPAVNELPPVAAAEGDATQSSPENEAET